MIGGRGSGFPPEGFESASNLLRAEQNREGSEFAELIKTYVQEGGNCKFAWCVVCIRVTDCLRVFLTKLLIDGK